jgi:hypothetical protein
MKSPRTIRTLAVLASAGLVMGAFVAAPAEAKKKKKGCAPFTAGVEGAVEEPTVQIPATATEEAPVTIEFEHGMAGPSEAMLNEEKFFNIQIAGPSSGLYVLLEFSERHDLDLYLYDTAGEEVDSSGGFNAAPEGPFSADGRATTTSESLVGVPVSKCDGFTVRSNAYLTYGTPATLKFWYGEPAATE